MTMPDLPRATTMALIMGPQGSEYRPISDGYEPHCAMFSPEQMHAYAQQYADAIIAALGGQEPVAYVIRKKDRPDAIGTPADAAKDENEALDLLSIVIDAYEENIACYEEPEEPCGFMGYVVNLDDGTFDRCCNLLNRRRPRALANDQQKGGEK